MRIKSWTDADLAPEPAYNTTAVRFFPWKDVEEPVWGGAWVAVAPGERTTPHAHHEKEVYFVVEGTGVMRMGEEKQDVGFGDTIYVTPDLDHDLYNPGPGRLLFLTVWWDGDEEES